MLCHAGIAFTQFTQWSKNGFFAQQRRHIAPIKLLTFGTGERTAGPLPDAKYHVYHIFLGRNVGIQPPNCQNCHEILAINLPLRGDSFAQFLRNYQRSYASIGSFYLFNLVAFGRQITKVISIFTQWGHFPTNFHRLLYHHAKYGGDRGSRAGCRQKSVMYFVFFCLSRFGITKFVITETLSSYEAV